MHMQFNVPADGDAADGEPRIAKIGAADAVPAAGEPDLKKEPVNGPRRSDVKFAAMPDALKYQLGETEGAI
jgi:hypothetical protein